MMKPICSEVASIPAVITYTILGVVMVCVPLLIIVLLADML